VATLSGSGCAFAAAGNASPKVRRKSGFMSEVFQSNASISVETSIFGPMNQKIDSAVCSSPIDAIAFAAELGASRPPCGRMA